MLPKECDSRSWGLTARVRAPLDLPTWSRVPFLSRRCCLGGQRIVAALVCVLCPDWEEQKGGWWPNICETGCPLVSCLQFHLMAS